jgi:tetraacyldisaccharide 4'-kinase
VKDARPPDYWDQPGPVPVTARALAGAYGGLAALRRALYARGLLRARHPGVPVVVIGNVVAGGTGKTPLAIAVVERLRAEGWSPGVATRGYGRTVDAQPRWVERESVPAEVGDEPLLIARRTGAPVRVDRDRAAAAVALRQAGCDVVVCDDGLQHYRLARDIEIEVVDARRRYGNGRLLPAGPLREPVERAERCDFRVLNLGADASAQAGFGVWPLRLIADQALPVQGGRARALADFAGQRVHAVAGIGDPDRFFALLRGFGIAIVPHAFPDHHAFVADDLAFGSPLPVLMTEKDAVKCAAFAGHRPFYSVPVRAVLPEAFWVALLGRLREVERSASAAGR